MRHFKRLMLGLLLVTTSLLLGNDFERLLQVDTAAEEWVVQQGYPLFYIAKQDQYRVAGKDTRALNQFGDDVLIRLSPQGRYAVLRSLQLIDAIKGSVRDGTYSVMDRRGDLAFQVIRSTAADLKPLEPAVSDRGILALGDPIKALVAIYDQGSLVTEIQLYGSSVDLSMERKMQLRWMGEILYIILEHPNPVGKGTANAFLFTLSGNHYTQQTYPLPFANIESSIIEHGHVIISGYDYDPASQQMSPMIVAVSGTGKLMWTNATFGHELALSSNGRYLAALASHELVNVFDLSRDQIQRLAYPHDNQASLGLAVNDLGSVALIRVPIDFFVKQNTYFTRIFFPGSQRGIELQLNPRSRDLFQLYSSGENFFVGTSYEWLRILE